MKDIQSSRKEINQIDLQMAERFEKRMEICKDIALYKKDNGLSIRDEAREAEVVKRNAEYIQNTEIQPYYEDFIRNTMDVSCKYQSSLLRSMRVAYCGIQGAFAYIASKRMFPEAEYVACATFAEAYEGVEKGEFDCAVLPLENSYAGEVGEVMDLTFNGSLHINQVIEVPITHNLIACEGATLDTIKTVVSHPQALAQCADYLKEKGIEGKPYSNTALAAEYVKNARDVTVGAIASDETAKIFGLQILEDGINDANNNTTRFASFSRQINKPVSVSKREDENFILVFTVQNESGALASALNIIGAHNFNMRSLRSRPMKNLQWNYYFYIEAEGDVNTQNGKDLMQELSALCAKLKLVGSYFADNADGAK